MNCDPRRTYSEVVGGTMGGGWLVLAVFLNAPTWAAEPPPGYHQIAREYGLPPKVLYAIALTESGKRLPSSRTRPWPWTLNIEGRGHYYPTRLDAFQALRTHLGRGVTNIDVGLMQVNWRYHRARLRDPWTALDPYYNLRLGAWLLASQCRDSQDLWEAVGRYHAPGNSKRAAAYRQHFLTRYDKLDG